MLQLNIRELLLAEIKAQEPKIPEETQLTQTAVLNAIQRKFPQLLQDRHWEQAVLTQWGELFRTGLLAWGFNLSNPNPPFFHLTERGRNALANITRDPSNPDGYLRHLDVTTNLGTVARSYLKEGLECYVDGRFKASAVMVGCAAERTILDLRDATSQKLQLLGYTVPKALGEWQIKTVSNGLHAFFEGKKAHFKRELREPFEAYWSAFAQQIRAARNDVGHPASVDPVTPDTIHASLLIFPELLKLAMQLEQWVNQDLK